MTRPQRKAHALIWTILGPALLAALIATILLRPRPPAPVDVPEQAGAAAPAGAHAPDRQPGPGEGGEGPERKEGRP